MRKESSSLALNVDTDQSALSQDALSRRSSRFLWTVFGFAILALMGVAARAELGFPGSSRYPKGRPDNSAKDEALVTAIMCDPSFQEVLKEDVDTLTSNGSVRIGSEHVQMHDKAVAPEPQSLAGCMRAMADSPAFLETTTALMSNKNFQKELEQLTRDRQAPASASLMETSSSDAESDELANVQDSFERSLARLAQDRFATPTVEKGITVPVKTLATFLLAVSKSPAFRSGLSSQTLGLRPSERQQLSTNREAGQNVFNFFSLPHFAFSPALPVLGTRGVFPVGHSESVRRVLPSGLRAFLPGVKGENPSRSVTARVYLRKPEALQMSRQSAEEPQQQSGTSYTQQWPTPVEAPVPGRQSAEEPQKQSGSSYTQQWPAPAEAPVQSKRAGTSTMVAANVAFSHELTSVSVSVPGPAGTLQAVTVPVAIWRPSAGTGTASASATYPYKIDIGKIAVKLKVGFLGFLPSFPSALPIGAEPYTPLAGFSSAQPGDHLMFTHGFLGSVYDFAHAAEQLAGDGFTVVAPELPESLSASYIPPEGMGREEILKATRELAESKASGTTRWGIWGHSAGAFSALSQPGEFSLGRACFAGGAGRLTNMTVLDPLFIVSSNGDGCNKFMAKGVVDLRTMIADGRTTMFESMDSAYAAPGKRPMRGAFIFADDNTPAPLPNHISFLWTGVNEAMINLLSPLLPIAKALNLFLLDFDVYMENRDGDRTAADLVPAMRRFFLSGSQERN